MRSKLNILSLVLFFASTSLIHAQYAFKAIVKDSSTSLPVADVVVKFQNPATKQLIAYGFTDNNGKINVQLAEKLILLESSHLAYKPLVLSVKIVKDSIPVFYLVPKEKIFEEVVVQVKRPMVAKGDTTVFRTESFQVGNERNIEELIKKMPHFSVDNEGAIYFKNKRIDKVLIDSEEITSQNYEIATRSLSASLIDEIEAIENHMENEVLRSVKKGKQSILNLKLKKKGSTKISGSSDIGIGINSHTATSTLLTFKDGWKSLTNLAGNNLGTRLVNARPSNYPLGKSATWTDNLTIQARRHPTSLFPQNLGIEQENINKERLISSNHSFTIHKKTKVTIGATAATDLLKANSLSDYILYSETPVLFQQLDTLRNLSKKLKLDSKLTYKPSKHELLTIRTYADVNTHALANLSTLKAASSLVFSQPVMQNQLADYLVSEYTRLLNKKNVLQNEIRFGRHQLNDELGISGGTYSDFRQKLLQNKSYYDILFNWLNTGNNRESNLGIYGSYQNYFSTLSLLSADVNNVTMSIRRMGINSKNEWSLKYINLGAEINSSIIIPNKYPTRWMNIANLSASKTLGANSILGATIKYTDTPLLNYTLNSRPLYTSFRTIQLGSDSLRINQDVQFSTIYTYNDLLKRKLQISIMGSFTRHLVNHDFANHVFQGVSQLSTLLTAHRNYTQAIELQLSKLVFPLRGTVKAKINYINSGFENVVNSEQRFSKINLYTVDYQYNTVLNSKFFGSLSGKVSLTNGVIVKKINEPIPHFLLTSHKLAVGYKTKSVIGQLEGNHIATLNTSFTILNGSIDIKLGNKYNLALQGRNLLDTSTYKFITITPLQRTSQEMALIGRQVLVSLRVVY